MTVIPYAAERRARGLAPARPDPMVAPGRMVRLPHGLVGTVAARGNDGRLMVRSGDVVLPCARDDVEPLRELAPGERVRIDGGHYGTVIAGMADGPWWLVRLDPCEDAGGDVQAVVHRGLITPIGMPPATRQAGLGDDGGRAA